MEYLVELIVLLLASCSIAVVAEYLKFPYTTALVLFGLAVSALKLLPEITLTRDLVFYLILPPLLFEGSLNMDIDVLRENSIVITTLSTLGVLISVLSIAAFLMLAGMDAREALLFGAMISPTDPVSVLAAFKGAGGRLRKLSAILEGESIMNDGTSVVIFSTILAFSGIVDGIVHFLRVCLGGIAIGLLMGYTFYQILRRIDDHLIEVTLTIVLSYLSFVMAEHSGFSGVMAVMFAGLLIGNRRSFAMSEETRVVLRSFWDVVVFLVNSIVFIAVGMDIAPRLSFSWLVALAVVSSIAGRALSVYSSLLFCRVISPVSVPYIPSKPAIGSLESAMLVLGGLRGTIPVALALTVSNSYPAVAELVFAVVLFSLVFQGLAVDMLARRLKLKDAQIQERE